jgi:hypothetical protein
MTTIIRNLDLVIDNPALPIIYGPFASVPGLIAGWRFSGSTPLADLSGNGHVLSAQGTPSQTDHYISGNKTNGYVTDISDALTHTIMCVGRLKGVTNDYSMLVSSLRQSSSANGIGSGLILSSNSGSNISRDTGVIGNTAYNAALAASVPGQAGTYADRLNFRFTALVIDGVAGTAKLFQPKISSIPITVSASAIGTRTVAGRIFRIGSWSDPTDLSNAGEYEIAEALFYNRAVSDSEVLTQYTRSKNYMAGYGDVI